MATTPTSPQLTTAEDLYDLDDEHRYELIRGELVSMSPAAGRHGRLMSRLTALLVTHVDEDGGGEIFSGDTGFILCRDPDTLVGPDIAFVRSDRLIDQDEDKFFELAPDLAVEIASQSDKMNEVMSKIAMHFQAGTKLIWIVIPKLEVVIVHHPDGTAQTLKRDETLNGGDVLPVLEIKLSAIFTSPVSQSE